MSPFSLCLVDTFLNKISNLKKNKNLKLIFIKTKSKFIEYSKLTVHGHLVYLSTIILLNVS